MTKFNAAGSALVYSTYLGGNGVDFGEGIAVDSGGNAYVTGSTNSTNFPTASPFQAAFGGSTDAFVTKLNPTGSALAYSTYLGGDSDDFGQGIAVDTDGNAFITGGTDSANFPTASAIQAARHGLSEDAFVTRFNPGGSGLVYSTYLGGGDFEYGGAIAVDTPGNAYITGQTSSTNFPAVNSFQSTLGGGFGCPCDAFVAKISPANPPPAVINSGGVVNSANFAPGAPLAAGSIGSVFGVNLANFTQGAAFTPLPTMLGGTTLQFNTTVPVPLFFASPLQINAQIPGNFRDRQMPILRPRSMA